MRVNSDATEPDIQLDANVIEQLPDVAPEEFPDPIGKLLGLTIASRGAGRATVEFEANRRYANPMGTLHGGVLCDLADAAMDVAYRSTRRLGQRYRLENLGPGKLRNVTETVDIYRVLGLSEEI